MRISELSVLSLRVKSVVSPQIGLPKGGYFTRSVGFEMVLKFLRKMAQKRGNV